MNHFRANPKPCAAIRELFIRAVWVDIEAQGAAVEIERALEIFDEDGDVMDAGEENAICGSVSVCVSFMGSGGNATTTAGGNMWWEWAILPLVTLRA